MSTRSAFGDGLRREHGRLLRRQDRAGKRLGVAARRSPTTRRRLFAEEIIPFTKDLDIAEAFADSGYTGRGRHRHGRRDRQVAERTGAEGRNGAARRARGPWRRRQGRSHQRLRQDPAHRHHRARRSRPVCAGAGAGTQSRIADGLRRFARAGGGARKSAERL